jgi:hypothetical protein
VKLSFEAIFLICAANESGEGDAVLTKKERFKKAVKEYGGTLIAFHVGISLISLGACYTAVSR